jgi:hypothetical protein
MNTTLTLGVYRRLDNRFEGLPDDSPCGIELHNRRKEALHAVLDTDESFQVLNWGETNDINSHEFVELTIAGVAGAVFTYAVVPGLLWLGKELAEKAVDTVASEAVKALIAKLSPKQEAKQLLDVTITMPDGTTINVDPPDRYATIHIVFADKIGVSINYLSQKVDQ